jgi:16S rRNA (cytosine967-C5)-methyltransferase
MNRHERLPAEWRATLALWNEVSGKGTFPPDAPFASAAISRAFKAQEYTASQRSFIVETLHYLLANYRRLDFALGGAPSGDALVLAALLDRDLIDPATCAETVTSVDWEWVTTAARRIAAIPDDTERFATERSLPNFLAQRLLAEYGDEADPLAAALSDRAPTCVRANSLKGTAKELAEHFKTFGYDSAPGHWSADAVTLDRADGLFKTRLFSEGLFEVQDEGSQLIAELVAPPPHGRVLDACAGAGGKTLALSALMRAKGTLLATDTVHRKLDELRVRARRAGAFNVRAVASPSQKWGAEIEALRGKFDRVLIDAPCSGTGTLRRNPELRWRIRAADSAEFARQQLDLGLRAAELLADNGRLIYATCSLLREENEDVVERLSAETKLEFVPVKLILGKERASDLASADGRFLKLLPHRHDTDGFFAAVLRKT